MGQESQYEVGGASLYESSTRISGHLARQGLTTGVGGVTVDMNLDRPEFLLLTVAQRASWYPRKIGLVN